MAGIAKITILGNLGRDPETKYTPQGHMNVQINVAVSRRSRDNDGSETTAWYRVTAWGKLAETLDKLTQQGALVKGRQVFVAGSLEPREYTAQDGTPRTSLDVNADAVQLAGSRTEGDGNRAPAGSLGQPPF